MLEKLSGVPAPVATALSRLKDDLTRAAGQNLAGLILYGGVARGRYRPGKSDVNVVVLLRDASPAALAAIAPALQTAWRAAGIDPLLLTPDEVQRAADVFATKFLDVKSHHVVLAGENPFAHLEVKREHLRLRVEQELRNLLLRLRRGYVSAGGDAALLSRLLTRAARPFALQLLALLQLAGKEVPAEDRTSAVFDAAAAAFGLEREPLARLAEFRHNTQPTGDVNTLYHSTLDAIARTADLADKMKESPG